MNIDLPKITSKNLAIKLNAAGERSVRKRHPWIFSESIQKINKEGQVGDIAVIFSNNDNKPIGVGLYDPHSPIRIKMLCFGSGAKIDNAFFSEKIHLAYTLRQDLLNTNTNSYRLLFGENDGFPSLIADVYANILVVKLYSAIWFPYFEGIVTSLLKVSKCESVVLRLSRNIQKHREAHQLSDGTILYGELSDEDIRFVEHGVHFSANVIKGHKTGYFLDHRHNRKRVGELSKGKKVLDVFAYAGGFSVHALTRGAREVTSVDISEQALQLARVNGKLNTFSGKHKTIAGDAFKILQDLILENKTFDVVIIDPPSFAKSAKEISMALKKYAQLALLGEQLVAAKGLLVLASCSSRVTAEEFFNINEKILRESGRKFKIIDKTHHDIDHPISFPEGAYLKSGYYRFS